LEFFERNSLFLEDIENKTFELLELFKKMELFLNLKNRN
jgi:hypothetical protein